MCSQKVLRLFMSLRVTFSNSVTFTVINEYGKRAAVETESVFRSVYHVACGWFISNRFFFHIYLSTFFGVRNFGNTEAMRVILFWKCSKFDVDLKNANENWGKVFCFSDKCIWVVCIELSLLRREYLSSTVNVLTKSLKTSQVSNSDFFEFSLFHSELYLW